jgi:phosphatidylglycerol:prolipoprotein diacylglycerol transferase
MHPILVRIPLPHRAVPLFTVLLVCAGVAAAVALYQLFVRREKWAARTAGAVTLGLAIAAFKYKGEVWNMAPVPIYSYGAMLGLSFIVGWYLTLGLSERDGLPRDVMANNYVVTAIAALIGSRVLYVLTNLNEFNGVADLFAFRRGGLVAYGGFLGGFVGSYFYLKQHGIRLLPWADVAVPSLASGLMITRLGCYMFGCDFGAPLKDDAPAFLKKLGTFPHWAPGTLDTGDGSPAWAQHVHQRGLPFDSAHSLPVHPTQLYESLVGASLLTLLLVARKKQKFRGEIFLLFTFAYGVCRYLLEILRDDEERGFVNLGLPLHVIVPLGFAALMMGYAASFSELVPSMAARRVTQALALLAPVGLFVGLRPQSFELAPAASLSTSQMVALTTGVGAAIAFSVFYKAALAHPAAAMALGLPVEHGGGLKSPPPALSRRVADDEEEDEDEREDERAREPDLADEASGKARREDAEDAEDAEGAERASGPSAPPEPREPREPSKKKASPSTQGAKAPTKPAGAAPKATKKATKSSPPKRVADDDDDS